MVHEAYGGPSKNFKGLLIAIDTFKYKSRPNDESEIIVLYNEDTHTYDWDSEQFSSSLLGKRVVKNQKRKDVDRIETLTAEYVTGALKVCHSTDRDDQCDSYRVKLPSDYTFGISATTGDNFGSFQVRSFKLYEYSPVVTTTTPVVTTTKPVVTTTTFITTKIIGAPTTFIEELKTSEDPTTITPKPKVTTTKLVSKRLKLEREPVTTIKTTTTTEETPVNDVIKKVTQFNLQQSDIIYFMGGLLILVLLIALCKKKSGQPSVEPKYMELKPSYEHDGRRHIKPQQNVFNIVI